MMAGLAAVLVLVACPTGAGECLQEPVRVLSYTSPRLCERQLPVEIRKARLEGVEVYGACNTVGANLLAGRKRIDIKAGPEVYRTASASVAPDGEVASFTDMHRSLPSQ
ncbi:hypothetical protein ACQQ2Q_15905 [Agrobacterium sp. ES01]|uniref:hypothetical protein n=1 Tax=Agrobacterium sp. ES01 TaxID=3420714 RepID=UPI003D0D4459